MAQAPEAPLSKTPILKIALTGGIACGKTMIRQFIEDAGIATIDADDVVHHLLAHDAELKNQIRREFGDSVFFDDGTVNRRALGDIVFKNDDRKKLLESWIHPKTRQTIADFFQAQAAVGEPFAIALIPLLFESNLESFYDLVWLIHATPEQQEERLISYRAMSAEDARRRIACQLSFEEKKQRLHSLPAWEIIENTGTRESAKLQIQAFISKLKQSL